MLKTNRALKDHDHSKEPKFIQRSLDDVFHPETSTVDTRKSILIIGCIYIYLYIPLQPWPFEVARCYDLYAQQHNLDPARSLVDYSHDPWHDARILLCV